MRKLIHTLFHKLTSILFPERCLGCRKSGELLCLDCRKKIEHKSKKTHRRQKTNTSFMFLDRLYSYGAYKDKIMRETLRRFKYHGTVGIMHPLADMLHDLIRPMLSSVSPHSIIIPIPAAKDRVQSRGYNQAELLAKVLSEKTSLHYSPNVLLKTKSTPSQISLSGRDRIFNVQNSFSVSSPESVFGKTIFLVDDISTTGATLVEASRVLKEAGAKKVIGVVVAI